MNDMQTYYLNGYLQQSFKDTPTLKRLIGAIGDLHAGHIKTGFSLEQKYSNSKDLRPSVYEYDESFLNILLENDIPHLLKTVTGYDLSLVHIQLRISYPGESYMDWHRDTHIYGGKTVGNIPPVHKVIFYPEVVNRKIPKLHVVHGSHRLQFGNQYVDMVQTRLRKKKTIESSNDRFLLFNTALLHAVVPEPLPEGSWRLIYSFAHEFQLASFTDQKSLIEAYKRKL